MQRVVEAVPEIAELKYSIFETLDRVAAPETILASNTSSISITEIALICYVPGHTLTGMWIGFRVAADGTVGLQ
jgi:3-hydroxybutyryl-CoA dehydrogenase